MDAHQIVRHIVAGCWLQLQHLNRRHRLLLRPAIPLAAPEQAGNLRQQRLALQHAGILLDQHQTALVPVPLRQIPQATSRNLVGVEGIGQGAARQQLIFNLLTLLLPLRFGDLLLQLQQAPHQTGAPLVDKELAQPLGGVGRQLAHQGAGLTGEGAVLFQRLQQAGQATNQLGHRQLPVRLIEQVLLLQRHRHRLVADLLTKLITPALQALFQQLAL